MDARSTGKLARWQKKHTAWNSAMDLSYREFQRLYRALGDDDAGDGDDDDEGAAARRAKVAPIDPASLALGAFRFGHFPAPPGRAIEAMDDFRDRRLFASGPRASLPFSGDGRDVLNTSVVDTDELARKYNLAPK